MPRWRKLHTKSLDSIDINEMPDDFTRLMWLLLPLGLDREGRGINNLTWIRSTIFPMREDVTPDMVAGAMRWYCDRNMIRWYTVDEREYFCIVNWKKYQGDCSREKESELPPPPDLLTTNSRQTHDKLTTKLSSDSDSDSDSDADTDTIGANAPAQVQPPPERPKGKRNKPAVEKLPREQDALFNAIAEVCKVDPATAGPSIGNVKAALLKAKPPYSADEVLAYGKLREGDPFWRDKGPPTLWQLKERIGIVRNGNGSKPAAPMTPAEQQAEYERLNPGRKSKAGQHAVPA